MNFRARITVPGATSAEARAPVTAGPVRQPQAYRPDIDGLRAIAVLIVVAFHAFPKWLPGGFVGVDVFFVISGFLITSIILPDVSNGRFTLADFYGRRVRRLFPALLLVLSATLVVGWGVLLSDEYKALGQHTVSGAGFVANVVYWMESGYFDRSANLKPLLHLWSLGIEEQFYFLWPLLLLTTRRNTAVLIACVLLLIGVSFAANILTVRQSPSTAFFLPHTRFWELIIGGMLAVGARQFAETTRSFALHWGHIASIAGLILLALAVGGARKDLEFPGWYALAPTAGAALLIAAGPDSIVNRALLSARPMVLVGLISYPLYLWHWPLLSYLHIIIGSLPGPSLKLAAVFLSFALAAATYRFVERPMRHGGPARRKVLILSIGLIALIVAGTIVSTGLLRSRHDSPGLQRLIAASQDKFYMEDLPIVYYNGQAVRHIGGPTDEAVLLIGDSHVQHLVPRLLHLAEQQISGAPGFKLAAMGGCPPIPYVIENRAAPGCERLREAALKLAMDPSVKAVALGGCWNCYFIHQTTMKSNESDYHYRFIKGPLNESFRTGRGAALALQQLETTLSMLVASGKPIFLILDNPYSDALDPLTYLKGRRIGSAMSVKEVPLWIPAAPVEEQLNSELKELAQRTGAISIDVRHHLCDTAGCAVTDSNGRFIYQDRNHLSATFMRQRGDFVDPIRLAAAHISAETTSNSRASTR